MNNYPNNLNYCQQQLSICQPNMVYPNPLEFTIENNNVVPGQDLTAMNSSFNNYNPKGMSSEDLMNYNCQLQNFNYICSNVSQEWMPYSFNSNKMSPHSIPDASVSPVVLSNVITSSPIKIENNLQLPHNICSEYNPIRVKKDKRPLIYKCDICDKAFDRKYVLKRHRGTHSETREYHCIPCKMSFYRKDIYDRHLTTKKCIRAHQVIYGPSYNGQRIISKRIARSNSFYYINNDYPCNQPTYMTGPMPVYNVMPTNQINIDYNYC